MRERSGARHTSEVDRLTEDLVAELQDEEVAKFEKEQKEMKEQMAQDEKLALATRKDEILAAFQKKTRQFRRKRRRGK